MANWLYRTLNWAHLRSVDNLIEVVTFLGQRRLTIKPNNETKQCEKKTLSSNGSDKSVQVMKANSFA